MTAEKKPKFRKATINACIYGDDRKPKPRPVPAIVIGDWAIHRIITGEPWTDQDGEYHDELGGCHVVTHIPTGFSIKSLEYLKAARYFAAKLLTLDLPYLGSQFGEDASTGWDFGVRGKLRKMLNELAEEAKAKG